MATTIRDVARIQTQAASDLRILNLTGHDVAVQSGLQVATFPPEAFKTRVEYYAMPLPPIKWLDDNGNSMVLPRRRSRRGRIINLPDPQPGVLLLVSRIVASYAQGRHDLLVPDGVMRDSRGHTFACAYLTEVDEASV